MNEVSKSKLQEICDLLRKETIDPARQKAREIVENSNLKASEIVENARKTASEIIQKAKDEIDNDKKIFEASMAIAAKQTTENLKSKIEEELFEKNLSKLVVDAMTNPETIAKLINAVVEAINKGGIDSDIILYLPQVISPDEINRLLMDKIRVQLKEVLQVKDFSGGAKIYLKNQKVTIDISNEFLEEMLSRYVKTDFRKKTWNL